MTNNLPDDVTHSDIDEHFGPPERELAIVELSVLVEVDVTKDCPDEEALGAARAEYEASGGEVVEMEVVDRS